MSKHNIAKPKEYQRGNYVDAAGIGGRKVLLPGEIQVLRQRYTGKSAEKLCSDLVLGKYRLQPIMGVEIPKSNGKTRLLGIPTVIDRTLQQAVSQVIM